MRSHDNFFYKKRAKIKAVETTAFFLIPEDMKVAIKKDFLIRTIANEKVLIGNGEQINFSKMIILNDTAAFIIKKLQEQLVAIDCEDLASYLEKEYEVGHAEALADVKALMLDLKNQNVVVIE